MRASLLLMAGLLGAGIPAAAQTHAQPGQTGTTTSPVFVARQENASTANLTFAHPRETFAEPRLLARDHSNSVTSSAQFTDTPFTQQVILPVISYPRGKFDFGGFYSNQAMENVFLGLPGAGALPAWSVASQNHAAVWAPYPDISYGMSFRIHLRSDDGVVPRTQTWRCLGKLIGRGQSCHLT